MSEVVKSVGRNDPCPCGSGQKYKKCCLLKEDQIQADRSAYEAHFQMRIHIYRKMMKILSDDFDESEIEGFQEYFFSNPLLDEDEIEELLQERDLASLFEKQFDAALLHAIPVREGLYLWQYALKYHSSLFNSFECNFLESWNHAGNSYYQVVDIDKANYKIILRDLFSDAEYVFYDKSLLESIVLHDLWASSLLPYREGSYIAGFGMLTRLEISVKKILNSRFLEYLSIGKKITLTAILKNS